MKFSCNDGDGISWFGWTSKEKPSFYLNNASYCLCHKSTLDGVDMTSSADWQLHMEANAVNGGDTAEFTIYHAFIAVPLEICKRDSPKMQLQPVCLILLLMLPLVLQSQGMNMVIIKSHFCLTLKK